ncbi:Gas vesicle protein G [Thermomonospora echinospora]|uniref:Gas vesicle protein G n=1 Tax=Thermomonospora echinospora TaxID=1992 RepID=A0A1H6CJE0_9ACTN|nr:gas vesicle protein GvpG [Thermomonospora echinospora]SEG72877.1 Gas vesicle protein G [Thermomonospora echinospora]
MNLLSPLWKFPFLPVQGLVKIAELLQEEADRRTRQPAALRQRLEELQEARASGLISEEEEARATEELFGEVFGVPPTTNR